MKLTSMEVIALIALLETASAYDYITETMEDLDDKEYQELIDKLEQERDSDE